MLFALSFYSNDIQGVTKKSLWCDVEEKCLRNYKIFFDRVFLSVHSHLLKKLKLSKLWSSKNPKNGLFEASSFLF